MVVVMVRARRGRHPRRHERRANIYNRISEIKASCIVQRAPGWVPVARADRVHLTKKIRLDTTCIHCYGVIMASKFESLRSDVHHARMFKAAAHLEECKAILAAYSGPGGPGRYNHPEVAIAARKRYMRAYATVYSRSENGRAVARRQESRKNEKKKLNRKSGAIAKFYREMLLVEKAKCFYCKRNLARHERTGDHFIPLSKGGPHEATNMRIACLPCNIAKSNRMPEEFMASLKRVSPQQAARVARA